jgi:O-antigen ligase
MENLKKYIKNNYLDLISTLVVITAAVGIFASPFIVDYQTLPKGFELPKVIFIQIVCVIAILLSFLGYILSSAKQPKLKPSKSFYLMIVVSILFIVSALISPYLEIAIWGNSFRLQGVITYLLLIWAAYGVYLNINRDSWHFLSLAFIFSTLIQCALAFNQFSDLAKTNPDAILEGYWVNGTFGQANWFAGRILIAIIFAAFYFGLRLSRPIVIRLLFKLYFALLIFIFLGTLGTTLSMWGIISACVAILLILFYELLPKKVFISLLILLIVIAVVASIIFLRANTEYNLRIEILNSSITILTQPIDLKQIKILGFGFGFDTLGEVYKDYGLMKGLLVDRGHNFIIDIVLQNGFIVFALFVALIIGAFKKMYSKTKNRIVDFTFIALLAWMFRSVIHENGIVNIFDFLIIVATTFALLFRLHNINSINTKQA